MNVCESVCGCSFFTIVSLRYKRTVGISHERILCICVCVCVCVRMLTAFFMPSFGVMSAVCRLTRSISAYVCPCLCLCQYAYAYVLTRITIKLVVVDDLLHTFVQFFIVCDLLSLSFQRMRVCVLVFANTERLEWKKESRVH